MAKGASLNHHYVLVAMVMLFSYLGITRSCSTHCTCVQENFGITARCRNAAINSMISDLPQNTKYLEINSAFGASSLSETTFDSASVFSTVNTLVIKDSGVQSISDNTFKKFTSLLTLNLTKNNIRSLTKNAFSGLSRLEKLDLAFNNMQEIEDEFTPLIQLQSLDLRSNSITSIQTGAFDTLVILNSLTLDSNRLQNVHGYTFQGLGNLRTLSIRNCGLHSIANDLFNIIRHLQRLDIGDNLIYQLPTAASFQHLPAALQHFIADGNQISELLGNQFARMNLFTLNLARNRLNFLSHSSFAQCNVRNLDLSSNSITTIEENAFASLAPQLEKLSLSKNPLQSIPLHVFDGLYRLIYLNLSTCSLKKLEDLQFQSLQSLRSLDISVNALEYLPGTVVNTFRHLQELGLYGNQWHCDCHIRPLWSWLQGLVLGILMCPSDSSNLAWYSDCRNPKCASPSSLQGTTISTLMENSIQICRVEEENESMSVGVIIGVTLGCIIILVIMAILLICICRHRHGRPMPHICGADSTASSHKEDREKSTTPFKDNDVGSLNESDKDFVVKRYFRSMENQPTSVVSRGTPSLSHKDFDFEGSCPSIHSVNSVFNGPIGYESTV